ncbi:putative selenate reductase [Hydrogenispora ethanolica]|uniref:Putative selenate reductase n=1 Tax=Hydrogenispora ethanolica TaxID=1082276 RepID=A0A4R1S1X4_HYDET|nr:putative selenate reductase subunit YgfK [Hydrogenispora ethanolica]TCL73158.1 putative selenate reductase [Hydrogenispora ethanolica]
MSDRMTGIPFAQLMRWAFKERAAEDSIFGVASAKFFRKSNQNTLALFGAELENPLGPAAGPHTQLAQNIIAAYLAGGRFFELKTVQILDGADLPVAKPCILAQDEGYNVEWSTELTVPDAFNEYVKAWFVLHILAEELGLGSSRGFLFNMSVGYDLAGIQSPKINAFIEGLKDASRTPIWRECREFLLGNLGMFERVDRAFIEAIPARVCDSITLSTLHGCPPEEIERIARYLLTEKGLHTYVKCNPTLLGYDFARRTLDQMGYDYLVFDDHHFQNDLQFADAVPMIGRLKNLAAERGLIFGVKLSNTFPVRIANQELPGEEMYMSGRSLYPLTINLAYRLAEAFAGDLRISYSGGADSFNIDRIYAAGIWPITLATTILKPGGYLRLQQLAERLEAAYHGPEFNGIDVARLRSLAESALTDSHHLKESREVGTRKLAKDVPLTDCFIAPCTVGCPIGQDVPEYLRLVQEGRYREAFAVIAAKNPLPFITGTLCNHRCMTKCTRIDYETPVGIRAAKLVAAERGFAEYSAGLKRPVIDSPFKVAVIGAGPAGLAAGYFLGRQGVDVTILDRKDKIGGIIQHIAPGFRISQAAIDHDLELVRSMGAKFRLGVDGNFSLAALRNEGFKYIFLAIGAWKPGRLKLAPCDREVINVLDFLETFNKTPQNLALGKNVAVVGAGNSAMDAARAAKRVAGVENVDVVYRRTRQYMPADRDELRLALADGVQFKELLAPLSFQNGVLRCQRMELGAPDGSGRRSPVPVPGAWDDLAVDSVIAAVGEGIETELLTDNGIGLDAEGRVQADPETHETSLANVFIGGDALRGPATIVEGIADGARFARIVLERENLGALDLAAPASFDTERQLSEIKLKKGLLQTPGQPESEGGRCLECDTVCNLCTEVCPNRANIAVRVHHEALHNRNQIVHLDAICNECGNCEAFCPYDSAPYRDKFTLYANQADFEESRNAGFLLLDEEARRFRVRLGEQTADVTFDSAGRCHGAIPAAIAALIWATYQDYHYLLR